jgi:hypothetical protein
MLWGLEGFRLETWDLGPEMHLGSELMEHCVVPDGYTQCRFFVSAVPGTFREPRN